MKKETIVIADDDTDLVQALRKRCEALGLYVVTAYDAFDALTSIHESQADLICLDVNMPSGNGLSVLEMLANDDDLSGIPVIIMSGDSNEETVRRCHNHCAYFVEKCSELWSRMEPLIQELLPTARGVGFQPADDEEVRGVGFQPADEEEVRGVGFQPADDEELRGVGFQPADDEEIRGVGFQPAERVEAEIANGRLEAYPTYEPTNPQTSFKFKGDAIVTVETENANRAETGLLSAETSTTGGNGLVDTVFEMLGIDETFFEMGGENCKYNSEPPWILCIDDDAEYSNALRLRLERHGVAVVRAFEGMDGYRTAFKRPADLILLDFEMPNGKGDYILGRLKDNPVTRDIPVVVITGRKDRALERKMINLGAAKFMNKPPNFDELLGELRNHIDILPRPVGI